MENSEALLLELEDFNSNNDEHKQINSNLENFIEQVAKTGTYIFPWQKIRNLYLHKLKYVLNNITPSSASHVSTTTTTTSAPTSLSPTSSILGTNLKSDFENEPQFNSSTSFNMFMQNSSSTDLNNVKLIKDRLIERMESFTSAPFTIQRISELLLKPNNHYNRPDKYLRGLEKCIMVVTTVDPLGCKIFVEDYFFKKYINYMNSQANLNTSSTATTLMSLNAEEGQIKTEDSTSLSLQQTTTATNDTQQNEMDISTTTSTITNVSSIENTIDSNENSEIEETSKDIKEENVENVNHLENVSQPIGVVDGYPEINKSDSAIDITENVPLANQVSMDSTEPIDSIEKQTDNFNDNEEKESKT